jgi:tetratricopeptide (TPR) repeat protein
VTEDGTQHQHMSPALSRFLKIQLIIGAVAMVLVIVSSSQVFPLIQRKAELERELKSLRSEIEEQRKEIEQYNTQLKKTRDQSDIMREGLIDVQSRQYTDAIREFDKAIELDDLNPNAYNMKGYAQLRNGDIKGAVETLRHSIDMDPKYVWGHYNLALAYWALGDHSNAIKEVKSVLDIKPEFREVLMKDGQFSKFRSLPEYTHLLGENDK